MTVTMHQVGEHAVLLDLSPLDHSGDEFAVATEGRAVPMPNLVASLWERLMAARESGTFTATDVVPAARTILVDGVSADDARSIGAVVDDWESTGFARAAMGLSEADVPVIEIPVTFDGPDLATVAELWGTSTHGVAEIMRDADLRVAFCGFAPGFAYMSGIGAERAVPRRTSPRSRVPVGAVGLAGEYTGIYPRSSPGGWQLLGTARDATLWDIARPNPALLVPGTRVRLVS
ncbi:5-oxoprolinase subunit B family protein [Demequina sediminicola]|uniref:5-oxoprolinase subunit B family protein n=1 Tax=Demequina sediminicola TaxID=1095026 RepID=UPI0007839A32|nr:carboxyltransferase domain-containing protein [Demequina sediminicola]